MKARIGMVGLSLALLTSVLGAPAAHAQGLLKRLEQRVQGVLDEAAQRAGSESAPNASAGYLGLTAEEDPESGILHVVTVKAGSPAQTAGFRVGDQIMTLDGRELTSMQQMADVLGQKPVGAKLTFGVLREGRRETMRATLAARPNARSGAAASPSPARAPEPDLELTAPADAPVPPRRGSAAPADRPVPGAGSPSVLRRLERSLDSPGRPAAPTPDEDASEDLPSSTRDRSSADGDLRTQMATLQKKFDLLQRRVEQLERRLASAGLDADLPEPRP